MVESFLKPCTDCLNPDFKFPGLGDAGLPNFALGTLMATMGGVGYVLKFLPPDPTNLPSPPGIGLFLDPFLGNIKMPKAFPDFSFGPLTIPGVPGVPEFDPSGLFKLIAVGVIGPFMIFKGIIDSIISLSPKIPGIPLIADIFGKLAVDVGLPNDLKFPKCIAESVGGLLKTAIPL